MSHLTYYNNCVELNSLFYNSHKQLIERLCKDLNVSEQKDDLIKKYLDKPDMKAKKDPNKPKRPKSAFLLFCDDERQKLIEKEKKVVFEDDYSNYLEVASEIKHASERTPDKVIRVSFDVTAEW